MSALLLPADADLTKARVKVFLADAEENPNGEVYTTPLANFSGNVVSGSLATTDDTYQGDLIQGYSAGATIAQWEVVYMGAAATWLLADGNGAGTYPARGLAVSAGSVALGALTVLTKGEVRNDAWTWTIGGNIYLSNTPGGLTQTATSTTGERLQMVGFAVSADKAIFNFTPTFATIP